MVQCKNCIYKEGHDGKKYCHRYPPTIKHGNPEGQDYKSLWPLVEGNWSCGEGKETE